MFWGGVVIKRVYNGGINRGVIEWVYSEGINRKGVQEG